MKIAIIILCMTVTMFNAMSYVGHDTKYIPIPYYTLTIEKTITPYGAIPININNNYKIARIRPTGNIPLRTQIGNSCGTTSLAMYMDWIGKNYYPQEYYDKCANRQHGEETYLRQIQKCALKWGVKLKEKSNYKIEKLKTGDMVIFHKLRWSNTSDLHISIVDSIEDDTIRIADTWGYYDTHNIEEFKIKYTGYALVGDRKGRRS